MDGDGAPLQRGFSQREAVKVGNRHGFVPHLAVLKCKQQGFSSWRQQVSLNGGRCGCCSCCCRCGRFKFLQGLEIQHGAKCPLGTNVHGRVSRGTQGDIEPRHGECGAVHAACSPCNQCANRPPHSSRDQPPWRRNACSAGRFDQYSTTHCGSQTASSGTRTTHVCCCTQSHVVVSTIVLEMHTKLCTSVQSPEVSTAMVATSGMDVGCVGREGLDFFLRAIS